MKRVLALFLVFVLLICMIPTAFATDYVFTDRQGNEITVPANAWATRVVEFTPGSPWTTYKVHQDVNTILGQADWNGKNQAASRGGVTLGAGGVVVLEFGINIFDGEGDDIYVFEIGDDVEPTKVEVSNDLKTWYDVGTAQGKTASVDLNGKVPQGSRFRYVRLTDLKKYPNGSWPGADIDAVAGLNIKSVTSSWSESEIDKAEKLDLIPDVLKYQDMTQKITRAEFAAVAVKVYESLSGTKAIPDIHCPFEDTNDPEVLKAYNLGVVNGTSTTTYEPDAFLNREQAATMLTRVFKRVSISGWTLKTDSQYPLSYVKPTPFIDDADISDWAKDSVYFMAANNIIRGIDGNRFAPKNTTTAQEAQGYANATREQALAIAVRMVENLNN